MEGEMKTDVCVELLDAVFSGGIRTHRPNVRLLFSFPLFLFVQFKLRFQNKRKFILPSRSLTSPHRQEIAHHSTHCLDYLLQSILCSADTTLEGETADGPGWGSEHECRDVDAIREWANERDVYKWRNALLPDEAVL